ncbi:MAG: sensor histidine kinase [Beutenbergiaceae bacterium]
MSQNLLLITVALLGLAVGAVGVAAFRYSEWVQRRERATEPSTSIGDDVAAVLGALNQTSMILDAEDGVLRSSPDAYALGLVRQGRLASPELAELVDQVRHSGTGHQGSVEVTRSALLESDTLSFDAAAAPLSGGRVLVLAQDTTASARLAQVRRDFVANVSHELKTPVGALSLLAETITDAAADPSAVAYFSEQMRTEAGRLSLLVQDIIDLSRLQAPDTDTVLVELEVDEILREAVDRSRVTAAARSTEIKVGGTSGLLVYGDHALLVTALRNLLDNAVRYSPVGGTVRVGVRERDEFVEVAVVDSGIGISRQDAERVFERFYRVDPARARETGGTGLGLSIVKHVASRHGGDVRLWSRPGRGSTFTIRIPQVETGRSEVDP